MHISIAELLYAKEYIKNIRKSFLKEIFMRNTLKNYIILNSPKNTL